jgi:hypothetical protein
MKPGEPRIVPRGAMKVAVVESRGEPAAAAAQVLPALFQAAYRLKFSLRPAERKSFHVGPLVSRWPGAGSKPVQEWRGLWALRVPLRTRRLPADGAAALVRLETWSYGGRAAEILHVGAWSEEKGSIERLHRFLAEQGYEAAGPLEEEYLTTPGAKVQKTVLRYPVRKRGA